MRMRKMLPTIAFTFALSAMLTACKGKGSEVLPTLAPTATPKPASESLNKPTPTLAPDRDNTKIVELNGEDFNQTSLLSVNSGKIEVKKIAYTGDYSFAVTGREDASQGFSMNFAKANGEKVDVVGKIAHIAMWVYQESGEAATFACSVNAKDEENATQTVDRFEISNVVSKSWRLLEGDVKIPSGVKNPTISITMNSSTADFYVDDLRVTYDPNSSVGAYEAEKKATVYYFSFNDGSTYLSSRGTGVGKISDGGERATKCLKVTDRSANWHGVEIDLTDSNYAGETLYVSYMAKHEESSPLNVICSLEMKVKSSAEPKYPNIAETGSINANTWSQGFGSFEIPENVSSVKLYFETIGNSDFYLDDVVISNQDISSYDLDNFVVQNGVVISTGEKEHIDTASFTLIHRLTGDSSSDVNQLNGRGSASVKLGGFGHSGKGFEITGRTASWNGAGIGFTNSDGKSFDVIGKEVYVSFWVYQTSGETVEFNATLQVTKPDGGAAWPERVGITALESSTWTFVEGIIPVYANISVPQINFEIPGHDTANFYLDDIVIMVNEKSSVPIREDYVVKEKQNFPGISLNFEDNNVYFEGRGNAKPSIVSGGHESAKCMKVSGRTSGWHGVQADLSDYDLAGKTVSVSYWLYHEYDAPIEIAFTAQQNDGTNETYTSVVPATEVNSGKWIHFSETFTFDETAKKYYLYFESTNETAEFYVDDVVIESVK